MRFDYVKYPEIITGVGGELQKIIESESENLFEKVRQKLQENNIANINENKSGYSLGSYLASKGVKHSILYRLNVEIDYATQGYAIGGFVDELANLLARGASKDFAVMGYAMGGYFDQVDDLLLRGVNKNTAVMGYAMGGYFDQVDDLLSRGVNKNTVVMGYARGGHFDKLTYITGKEVQDKKLRAAICGYAKGGYVNKISELLEAGKKLGIQAGEEIDLIMILANAEENLNNFGIAIENLTVGRHFRSINDLISLELTLRDLDILNIF